MGFSTGMNGKSSTTATSLSCFLAGVVVASLGFRLLRQTQQQKSCQRLLKDIGDKNDEESNKCIYLDYNGTTPVNPFVIQAMMPYLTTHYGNPSSSHWYGQEPRHAVDRARQQILHLFGLGNNNDVISNSRAQQHGDDPKSSIWFTACGTESDNLAIHLALQSSVTKIQSLSSSSGQKPHIVTCNVEHPAIEACLKVLQEEQGLIDVTYVPVQSDGRVLAQDMINAIDPKRTILVTLMLANNETGALQPVPAVARYCRQQGILFHTDAAQAAGKVSVEISPEICNNDDDTAFGGGCGCADMVTLVGHKIGAPKGIACLYVRPQCLQENGRSLQHNHGVLLIGGGQEYGRRGGTENVPYIVAMGVAAERAMEWRVNAARMESLRTRLLHQLRLQLGCCDENDDSLVRPNGPTDPEHRLPNTLSVGIRNVHSGDLLAAVSDQIAASAGAACHSHGCATGGVSSVLMAMKIPMEFARGTLRLSLGPTTTQAQIDHAAAILAKAAKLQLQQKES